MHKEKARNCLNELGMTEYESKAYLTLTELKIASPRELCEFTGIPRTKIYTTLDSLQRYGYVTETGETPARYKTTDIDTQIKHLKEYFFELFTDLGGELRAVSEQKCQITALYNITNLWAVTQQIKMIINRAKTEIIIFCSNPEIYKRYEAELLAANKKLDIYLITADKTIPQIPGLSYYYPGKDLLEGFIKPNMTQKSGRSVVLTIFRDATEELTVFRKGETTEGALIANSIYAQFISRVITAGAEKIKQTE